MGSSVTTEEEEEELALSGRTTLKEGERVLVPTRRPDGTLRKPIRIRAGYVPQDEVAIYQSKGALLRKCNGVEVPPGYDPVLDAKAKTSRSAKRNERKKEKKQQAALVSLASDEGKNLDSKAAGEGRTEDLVSTGQRSEVVESVAHQMNKLSVCTTPRLSVPPSVSTESSNPGGPGLDLDKKIRALKKKIRLTEALENVEQDDLKPEQSDKLAKLEGWRKELKLLENRKAPPLS
ncbi:partner of Y14 and mago-like protein [Cinnamomum micranthum f. kanehirae]|uniref:Partner of Y14 and mago-like protein n=1 Tax=Cinnamomum micranthum f. kanehirae TaxID=337451 RepID=A0A443NJ75_9MAGN|nr:partner of Y14 and mago-like protein [Cinnamomum micranthum f. kanehirae]